MATAILESPSTSLSLHPRSSHGGGTSEMCPGSTSQDQWIESRAKAILAAHPNFLGRSDWVQFQCTNPCLQIQGRLPSFFLKQLVQEAVKRLGHDIRIENRIVVASPTGEIGTGR